MSKPIYTLFIGRWQTPRLHDGHLWLFQQAWDKGEKVLIAIRDVEVSEKNPYTAEQVLHNIRTQLTDKIALGMVNIMIIPDISKVAYGRDVGYEVVELVPPPEIASVSATAIRKSLNLKDGGSEGIQRTKS